MNASVFTFVNAVLIRGLPFDDPDRILSLSSTWGRQREPAAGVLGSGGEGAGAWNGCSVNPPSVLSMLGVDWNEGAVRRFAA